MSLDITIEGDDQFGSAAYGKLFEEIMDDLNKSVLIDKVKLVLKPSVPLFVFSVVLKAEPSAKTLGDVSNVRSDNAGVHITITQERYAPDILFQLWSKYGRRSVVQQTRFDIDVANTTESEVSSLVISTGEEDTREIMGAIWRVMPEGIKNRRTLMDGGVITVVATEEIMKPEMMSEGRAVHASMGGVA